ncbi:hypothetical protein [Promicromonospora sukumoe]|uniref:hypothetical protein n=1 Tax=Promicromonospora sukumoe TaxID=88382 RepID=UPI0036633CAE
MSVINDFRDRARYLSIALILAAAGAAVAALNHVGTALGFATGAASEEEIASALASQLIAMHWGLISLLLFFSAVGLHIWLTGYARGTRSPEIG